MTTNDFSFRKFNSGEAARRVHSARIFRNFLRVLTRLSRRPDAPASTSGAQATNQ